MECQRGLRPPGRAVVWISHRDGDRCQGCGAEITKGTFLLVARETGIRCLECAGLADFVYLPAGDPGLTRRAVASSGRSAMVVKFSRTRKRHERQGILVEQVALERATEECEKDQARREAASVRQRAWNEVAEQECVARFAGKVRDLFPACPPEEAEAIARPRLPKVQRPGRTLTGGERGRRDSDHSGRARACPARVQPL